LASSDGSQWSDPDFRSWEGSSGNIHEFDWNPMYRGAWHAIVHRFAKNQTQPKQCSTHTQTYLHMHLTSNCLFIEYIGKLKS